MHNCIYLWSWSATKAQKPDKKSLQVSAVVLAELQWTSTEIPYLSLNTCPGSWSHMSVLKQDRRMVSVFHCVGFPVSRPRLHSVRRRQRQVMDVSCDQPPEKQLPGWKTHSTHWGIYSYQFEKFTHLTTKVCVGEWLLTCSWPIRLMLCKKYFMMWVSKGK